MTSEELLSLLRRELDREDVEVLKVHSPDQCIQCREVLPEFSLRVEDPVIYNSRSKTKENDTSKTLGTESHALSRSPSSTSNVKSANSTLQKRRGRRGRRPREWYAEVSREKILAKRWAQVTHPEVVDWWCWLYAKRFGMDDPAFSTHNGIEIAKQVERLVQSQRRALFDGDTESLMLYLATAVRWWREKRERGDDRPRGLPRLRTLLESDYYYGLWCSGDMAREIGRPAE